MVWTGIDKLGMSMHKKHDWVVGCIFAWEWYAW